MALLTLADTSWRMTGAVADLSIPLHFDGAQPNHFGADAATQTPMRSGNFTGDTRQGGSCNATEVTLNPHCNGTHTECVGHLTRQRVSIRDLCPSLPVLCALVSVQPEPVEVDQQRAHAVTHDSLAAALDALPCVTADTGKAPIALAIRTLPNTDEKLSRRYTSTTDSVFIDTRAMGLIVDRGVDHLLVDMPSIDPFSDGGHLAAHRQFFGLPTYADCPAPEPADATRAHATVTEMIYAPESVSDGLYLLNLQIPGFELDAAPSRPLLYTLEPS